MKKLLVAAAVVAVPLALVLGVAQARRFDDLRLRALSLEERQKDLIEENRKLVAALATLGSRERVAEALEGDPDVVPVTPGSTLEIVIDPNGGGR